jgi:hypothetical protein
MKSFRISLKNVATIVACFAVSLMLFTGCEKDDPAPEPEGNGIAEIGKTYVSTTANAEKVYTLKVRKILLKSTVAATDTYVLLYVDKSGEVKTSTGVVTSSVGESLTLTPTGGTPFTVTVTANGITGISGIITFTDSSTATGGNLTPFANGEIEITGTAITEDRVLVVPGMAINYVYNGTGLLAVNDSKILTVLPGTTIRFTQTGGGIEVKAGATVKMLGEDKLRELDAAGNLSATPGTKSGHITMKSSTGNKGRWRGIKIASVTENVLDYVEILNAGSENYDRSAALYIDKGKASVANCMIDRSSRNGITLEGRSDNQAAEFVAFSNNTVSNCDKAPIYTYSYAASYALRNLANNNTFTGNANAYIHISQSINTNIQANMTLPHLNGYPWYFQGGLSIDADRNVIIEAGAVILVGANTKINVPSSSHLIAAGTPEKRITIKGLQNNAGYWDGIEVSSQSFGTKFEYCDISGGGRAPGGAIFRISDPAKVNYSALPATGNSWWQYF